MRSGPGPTTADLHSAFTDEVTALGGQVPALMPAGSIALLPQRGALPRMWGR